MLFARHFLIYSGLIFYLSACLDEGGNKIPSCLVTMKIGNQTFESCYESVDLNQQKCTGLENQNTLDYTSTFGSGCPEGESLKCYNESGTVYYYHEDYRLTECSDL